MERDPVEAEVVLEGVVYMQGGYMPCRMVEAEVVLAVCT